MLYLTNEGKKALIVLSSILALLLFGVISYFTIKSGVFFPSASKFRPSDISYSRAKELKINLDAKEKEIRSVISDLQNNYYDNDIVKRKVNSYNLYLEDMNAAKFSCKETDTHGVCSQCKTKKNKSCSTCAGKIYYFKDPCLCKGIGVLTKKDLQ